MDDQYRETAMADAVYAYYPTFRRLPALNDADPAFFEQQADEVGVLFEKFADRVTLRSVYTATGFRPDTDLLFWLVASSADAAQELLVQLRRTPLGRALELTYAFLGVTRPAEFNPDHLPSFLKGETPKRYMTVYPFVRTEEWYLLPPDERAALLRDHGRMGREFPEVLPNTTSAFGLGDWEWILAFESDDLTRIVDCIRRLREAEARRFTKLDVPFVLGIRTELRDAICSLA
jgi:chlorite dismutase